MIDQKLKGRRKSVMKTYSLMFDAKFFVLFHTNTRFIKFNFIASI